MMNYVMLIAPITHHGIQDVASIICESETPYDDDEVRALFKRVLQSYLGSPDWDVEMGDVESLDWGTLIAALPDRLLEQHGLRVLTGNWAVRVVEFDEVVWSVEDGVLPE